MPRYKLTTLVDITRTQATRAETDEIKISQQANFNSLIQAIGMRSNIEWKKDPERSEGTLPTPFDGRGTYWCWEFEVERDQIFEKDDDPVGLLKEDINGVPVIDRLENSVELNPPVFIASGEKSNIYIEII